MDYNKMKVNDLKAELAARNLDTKGVKAVLVERLKEAIEKENSATSPESASSVTAVKKLDASLVDQPTPVRRSRRRSMTRSPSPTRTETSQRKSVDTQEHAETADLSSCRKKRKTRSITKSPSPSRISEVRRLEVLEEEIDADAENVDNVTIISKDSKGEPIDTPTNLENSVTETSENIIDNQNEITSSQNQDEKTSNSQQTTINQTSEEASPGAPKVTRDAVSEIGLTDPMKEFESKDQEDKIVESMTPESIEECKLAQLSEPPEHDPKSEKESGSKSSKARVVPTAIEFVAEENEPVIDNSKILLSWYDSDLNMDIDSSTFDAAKPLSEGAFSLLLAGTRANFGVQMGKIAFEVMLTKVNEWHKVTEEAVTSEFRVGWSVADANLQLGESKLSFAFINSGLKATNNSFTDYGTAYTINDVIGIYLDLDSNPCKIEYSVNNVLQGTAFEFQKSELEGKALYPHVCSKNIAFKINFGQLQTSLLNERRKIADTSSSNKASKEEVTVNQMDKSSTDAQNCADEQKDTETDKECAAHPNKELSIQSGYTFLTQSPTENLLLGPCRPESRSECEIIFLIGLPASGKTEWVQNYVKDYSDKKYTILSIGTLLDQMRLLGVPRKPENTKKWPRLIDQLSKCLNKLTEIAAKRRMHFIFDQTNIFLSEQKRKLRGFGEYATRKAVIVVPDAEEHQRRIKKKNSTFGIDVSDHQLNVMKAHFHLPSKELNWFTEITYAELDEEKSAERVKKMNEEGKKALPRGFNKNHQMRRGAKKQHGWNQINKRSSNVQQYNQGGFNTQQQRYKSQQQYSQNRNYRQDGRYGRQDSGFFMGHYDRNSDWTRGRFDHRFNNRGMWNNQSGSNYRRWSQQNTNCWSNNGDQGSDAQQWYSWWQSNVKNLLQQGDASGCSSNSQRSSMDRQWSQYTQPRNYGNYQQSKYK